MDLCPWCGESHPVDQLCQRGQQGLTRRSFCFLFGSGLVAVALPWPMVAEVVKPYAVPIDGYTQIVSSLLFPAEATFRTNQVLQLGQEVSVERQGVCLFRGIVDLISWNLDKGYEVRAADIASERMARLRTDGCFGRPDTSIKFVREGVSIRANTLGVT